MHTGMGRPTARWTARGNVRALRTVALLVLIVTSAAACGGDDGESATGRTKVTGTTNAIARDTSDDGVVAESARPPLTFYRPATVLASGAPGEVLSKEPIELAPELHGTGWKITYVSTTPAGDLVPVSGVLIQPLTPAPAGGYPVVVWGHGTIGLGDDCAPSNTTPFDVTGAASLLDAGAVIAAPDYEGLGIPDEVHPYLVGASEGHNALDAARAARTIGAGTVTVTWGWSEGGHAALFARELQPSYAPELDFRGAAAQAPATDVGALLLQGTTRREVFTVAAAMMLSWSEVYEELALSDLLVVEDEGKVRLAQESCVANLGTKLHELTRPLDELFRVDPQNSVAWQEAARINSVEVAVAAAPVLLTHGDADTIVPVAGTVGLFDQLCAHGVSAKFIRQASGDHFTAWDATMHEVTEWIADRITGTAPPSDCS